MQTKCLGADHLTFDGEGLWIIWFWKEFFSPDIQSHCMPGISLQDFFPLEISLQDIFF